jgi:parallel beta-helix repeat protein
MKHKIRYQLVTVFVILNLVLFSLVIPVHAQNHHGDPGPNGTIGIWGAIHLSNGQQTVPGVEVTVGRNGQEATACTYENEGIGSGCDEPYLGFDHTDIEDFPFYGMGIGALLADVMQDGTLSQTVTLTITAVYNDHYSATGTIDLAPEDINQWGEVRVDMTLPSDIPGSQTDSYGGAPTCADFLIHVNVTCDGSLILDSSQNQTAARQPSLNFLKVGPHYYHGFAYGIEAQNSVAIADNIQERSAKVMHREIETTNQATVIYVAPGANCGGATPCFATLQAAANNAISGDEIRIAAGTYTDINNQGSLTQILYISTSLTIRGGYTITNWTVSDPIANPTVLDAQGLGRVIYVTGNVIVTVENLQITGGNSIGLGGSHIGNEDAGGGIYVISAALTISNSEIYSNSGQTGGGIYIQDSVVPSLLNNEIYSNTGRHLGGGIYLYNSPGAIVQGNFVHDNVADSIGGGMKHCGGFRLHSSSDSLWTNNRIENNHAANDGAGGCFFVSANASLLDNQILNNIRRAGFVGRGAGLWFEGSAGAYLSSNVIAYNRSENLLNVGTILGGGLAFGGNSGAIVEGNQIYGNVGTQGGGIYVAPPAFEIIITNNIITGNLVIDSAGSGAFEPIGYGGGLYLGGPAMLMNNIIADNQTDMLGSGGGIFTNNVASTVDSNRIYGNTARDGGGIFVNDGSSLTLTNNWIYKNGATSNGAGVYVDYFTTHADIIHNSIVSNTLIGNWTAHSGIFLYSSPVVTIVNNIIVFQPRGIMAQNGIPTATIDYNDLVCSSACYLGGITAGVNDISDDPLFVDAANDDYHVQAISPVVNRGTDMGILLDIDGDIRPIGFVDIGADENLDDPTMLMGTATSIVIQPISLVAWQSITLTANTPISTSIQATVLDVNLVPIPCVSPASLATGITVMDISCVKDPPTPLRLRLDLASAQAGVTPTVTDWRVNWEKETDTIYQVVGEVYDGHHHPLVGAEVTLWRDGLQIRETETDELGQYTFPDLMPKIVQTYQVRVTLRHSDSISPTFQVRYAQQNTYDGPVVYLQTPPFTLEDPIFTTYVANFNFNDDATTYESNVVQPERLDDIAAIYHHTYQVMNFIDNNLATTLRPLDMNVYSQVTADAYYDAERSAVVLGAASSHYRNGNRPMNREWHEVFHALMADTIGIPDLVPYPEPDCQPGQAHSHGGYRNCSTADSWIEGYAEFWTLVLWDELGWPKPHLYLMWGTAISMEYNWQVWDYQTCPITRCPSREEFAVASLLWDLYDDPIHDDEFMTATLDTLWAVLGDTTYNNMRDMKDVYDALVAAGVGQTDSVPDNCPTADFTDLDDVFIQHGFFYDADNDQEYDCGEEIGRAANSGRPGRRHAPSIDAFIMADVAFPSGITGPVTITVGIHFEESPELNYSYETLLQDGQLYIEPPPPHSLATVIISARTNQLGSINPLVMTNVEYWDIVAQLPPGQSVVLAHTFDLAWFNYLPLIRK